MNSKLLLLSVSIITLASCSTAYKTGQTPDDVYYSPVRFYGEGTENKNDDKKNETAYRNYSEDRQIRMGMYDRRWRDFDNDFSYSPYQYGYNYGYYYNPFYNAYPVYNTCVCSCVPVNPKVSTPRMTNLGGYGSGYNYTNNSAVNSKYGTGAAGSVQTRSYNNSNKGSKLGSTLNNVFNNNNSKSNNDNNNNSSSNRSYSPSSSSSSSSSGSSSGSSSRPARNGRN